MKLSKTNRTRIIDLGPEAKINMQFLYLVKSGGILNRVDL